MGAEIQTTAQHLTAIDFDISGIRESLKQSQTLLLDTVNKINTDPKYKIKLDFNESSILNAQTSIKGVEQALKNQVDMINKGNIATKTQVKATNELAVAENDLAKIVSTLNMETKNTVVETTKLNGAYEKIITTKKTYANEQKEDKILTEQTVTNIKAQSDAYNKQTQAMNTLITKYSQMKTQTTGIKNLLPPTFVTEFDTVTAKIGELQVKLSTLNQPLKANEFQALQQSISGTISKLESQSSSIVNQNNKVNSLLSTYKNLDVVTKKLTGLPPNFNASVDQAKVSLAELQKRLESGTISKNEFNVLANDIQRVAQEQFKLINGFKQQTAETDKQTQAMNTLIAKYSQMTTQTAGIKNLLPPTFVTEFDTVTAKIGELQVKLSTLNQPLKANEFQALQQSISGTISKLESQSSSIVNQNNKVNSLLSTYKNLDVTTKQLTGLPPNFNASVDQAKVSLAELQKRLESGTISKNEFNVLANDIQRVAQEQFKLINGFKQQTAETDKQTKAMNTQKNQINNLINSYKNLAVTTGKVQTLPEGFTTEIDKAILKAVELQRQLATTKIPVQNFGSIITELKNVGDDYKRQIQEQVANLKNVQAVNDTIIQQEKQLDILRSNPVTSNSTITTQAESNLIKLQALMQQVSKGEIVSQEQLDDLAQMRGIISQLERDTANRIAQEKQLNDLLEKQRLLISKTQQAPTSTRNTSMLREMETNYANLVGLQSQLSNQNVFTPEQQTQLAGYNQELDNLNQRFNQANTGANNMLATLINKAKWLGAFYFVTQIVQKFRQMITTIEDTEMAVVDLQRVLNDDSLGEVEVQTGLFDIAKEYARTMEEVQTTSVKFAQTGADWNDTLKLTEATMLAVNTAELSVETATTGLIAVMAQFGLETKDVLQTIDKINITSDSFAVTSEKLVTALQRAGGTAATSNLSLEQTISLITALSTATGRSGENLGTALNSIIQYTQNAGALDVFSSLGDESLNEIIENFKKGAGSIVDVWTQLSKTLSGLDKERQEALAITLSGDESYNEFATQLESEATELTSQIKETYATAGVYRQNYFIALLNSMSEYTDSMENMQNFENYSIKENEKYMATLTASYRTLVATAKELAVGFGNAGFLDFLKLVISGTTDVINLTQEIGGLKTVLWGIISIWSIIKRQQIADSLGILGVSVGGLVTRVGTLGLTLSTFVVKLKATALAMTTATFWTNGFKLALSLLMKVPILVWIPIVSTVISALTGAFEESIRKIKENIQALNDNANALMEEKNKVNDLIDSYIELNGLDDNASNREKILELQEQITKETGQELDVLKDSNKTIEERISIMKQVALQEIISLENANAIRTAYQEIAEEVENAKEPTFFNGESNKMYGANLGLKASSLEARAGYSTQYKGYGDELLQISAIEDLEERLREYEELQDEILNKGYGDSALNKEIAEVISNLRFLIDEQNIAVENNRNLVSARSIDEFQKLNDNIIDTIEEYENYIDVQKSYLGVTETTDVATVNYSKHIADLGLVTKEQAQNNIDFATSFFSHLIPSTEEATKVISSTAEALVESQRIMEVSTSKIEEYNNQINDASNSFGTIREAMEEYNNTGSLQISTLQSLLSLSPEYFQTLDFTGGKLNLVKGSTDELINSSNGLINALLQEQLVAQITAIVQEELGNSIETTGEQANTTQQGLSNLDRLINQVASSALNGTADVVGFATAVSALDGEVDSTIANSIATQVQKAIDNANNLKNAIGGMNIDFEKWGGSGSEASNSIASSSQNATSQVEKFASAYEDLIDIEQSRMKLSQAQGVDYTVEISHIEELIRLNRELLSDYKNADPTGLIKEIIEVETEIYNLEKDIQELIVKNSEEIIAYEEEKLKHMEVTKKSYEEQIKQIEKQQLAIHELAEEYRAMGYLEDSSEIMQLQIDWVEKQSEKIELRNQKYQDGIDLENASISMLEKINFTEKDRLQSLQVIYDLSLKQLAVLQESGKYEENSVEILNAKTKVLEAQEKIVETNKQNNDNLISLEEKRLNLLEVSNGSSIEQIGYLQRLISLNQQAMNDLKNADPVKYASEILDYSIAIQEMQNEINNMLVEQADKQRELEIERYESQIEALEKQKDAISERADREVEALQKVEKENDRIRAKEDYLDKLADAKKNLASAEARSGVQYREQEVDAKDEISDIYKDWQEQIEDWRIEDTIEKIREIEAIQLASIDNQIDKIQASIDIINSKMGESLGNASEQTINKYMSDMINANNQLNETNLINYQSGYIDPSTELAKNSIFAVQEDFNNAMVESIDTLSTQYESGFIAPLKVSLGHVFGYIQEGARINSEEVYKMYKYNLVDRLKADISNLFATNNFYTPSSQGYNNTSNTNTYNNGNKNMNMYVDLGQNNSTKSQKTINDFFKI